MGDFDKYLGQFSICGTSTSKAGAFSESSGLSINGTLAEGRSNQSPYKNWILLHFAKRVADGNSNPHETAFMSALMAADIPDKPIREQTIDVANTIGLLIGLENMDYVQAVDCLKYLDKQEADKHEAGGE